MARWIPVGEAAELAGVSEDTIRRRADAGELHARRDRNGHRLILDTDARRLAGGTPESQVAESGDRPSTGAVERRTGDSHAPAAPAVQSWERRVNEAHADVAVLKAKSTARKVRLEVQEDRERRARDRQREEQERQAEQERQERHELRHLQREHDAAMERARLDALRTFGRSLADWQYPDEARGRIARDLQGYVNATTLPPGLSDQDARELVKARVQRVLKPYDDRRRREEQRRESEQRRASLLRVGNLHAFGEPDAELRDEVRSVLEDEVADDWTEQDVRARVDQVLAGEDDDDEGEGDEYDDDEDGDYDDDEDDDEYDDDAEDE